MPEIALDAKVDAALALLLRVTEEFSPAVFACSFGAEDMVLVDLIARHQLALPLLSIDTGRLPPETYELMAQVEARYGLPLGLVMPEADDVEALVARQGINGFYQGIEQRKACCHARKVKPLQRALTGKRAWVTGLRVAQAATREGLAEQSFDASFGLTKFNPLASWSEDEVWAYLRRHEVPTNALHAQNYPSIGCAPCTRAVQPGEDIRAGRWWWEQPSTKECGLHWVDGRLQRVRQNAAAEAPLHG